MNDGNPGSRSPERVYNDADYMLVKCGSVNTYPAGNYCIFEHLPTGSFWKAVYGVRDDDSDWGTSCHWVQVTEVRCD